MADEEKPAKTRRRKLSEEPAAGDSGGERRSRKKRRLTGSEIAQAARRELAEITGLEAESATSLEPGDDGGWIVSVELLELSRLPNTDDLLGLYEVELDDDGELLAYRRVRRYARSQAGERRPGET